MNLMTRLITATDSAKKSFNSLRLETDDGILLTFERFSRIAREDVFQALDLLSKNFDKLADKPDVLRSLFTVRQWSTIAPLIKDINGNTKEWIKTYTEGKSVAEGFETQMQSLDKQLAQFKNNIDNMNSGWMDTIKIISSGLIPILNSAMQYLHDVDNGLVRITAQTSVLALEVLVAVGAIKALFVALAGSSAMTAGIALATNPITLALVGISSALTFIYLKSKDISKIEEERLARLNTIKKETEELVKQQKLSADMAQLYLKSIKEFEDYDVSKVWDKTVDLMKEAVSSSEEILGIMQKISNIASLNMNVKTNISAPSILNADDIAETTDEIKKLETELEKIKNKYNYAGANIGEDDLTRIVSNKKEYKKVTSEIAEKEKKIYDLSTTKAQKLLDIEKQLGDIRNFEYMQDSLATNEKYQDLLKKEAQLKADILKEDEERLLKQDEINQSLINYNTDLQRLFATIETETARDFLSLVDTKNLKDLDEYISKTQSFMPTLKNTIKDMEGLGLFENMTEGVTKLDIVASPMFNKWSGAFNKFSDISKDINDTISKGTVQGLEKLIKLTEEDADINDDVRIKKIAQYEAIKLSLMGNNELNKEQVDVLKESLEKVEGMQKSWVDLIIASVEVTEELKKQKIYTSDIYEGINRTLIKRQSELSLMDDGLAKLREQQNINDLILTQKVNERDALENGISYAKRRADIEKFISDNAKDLDTTTNKIQFTDEKIQAQYEAKVSIVKALDVLFKDILGIEVDIKETDKDIVDLNKNRLDTITKLKNELNEQKNDIKEQLITLENINKSENTRTIEILNQKQKEKEALDARLGNEDEIKKKLEEIKSLNEDDYNTLISKDELDDDAFKRLSQTLGFSKEYLSELSKSLGLQIEIENIKKSLLDDEKAITEEISKQKDIYSAMLNTIDKITSGQTFTPSFNMEGVSSFISNLTQGKYNDYPSINDKTVMTEAEWDNWKPISQQQKISQIGDTLNFGITQYNNVMQNTFSQEANNIKQRIDIMKMQQSLLTDEEDIKESEERILREQINLIKTQAQAQATQSIMGGVTGGISGGLSTASSLTAMGGTAASMANPVGIAVGVLGIIGGLFGADSSKKQARQQEMMLKLQAETNRLLELQNENIAKIEQYQQEGSRFGTKYAEENLSQNIDFEKYKLYTTGTSMAGNLYNKASKAMIEDLQSQGLLQSKKYNIEGLEDLKTELTNLKNTYQGDLKDFLIGNIDDTLKEVDNALLEIGLSREKYYNEWYGFDVQLAENGLSIESKTFNLRGDILNNYIDNAKQSYSDLGKVISNTFSTGYLNNYVKEVMGLDDTLNNLEQSFTDFIDAQISGTKGFGYGNIIEEVSKKFSFKESEELDEYISELDKMGIAYERLDKRSATYISHTQYANNRLQDIVDLTSELASKQKDVNEYTRDYLNEWVRVGGKISDVSDLIGYGIYDGISSALDETSYADRFNSLGTTIGSSITDKIKREFINANFEETILGLNTKLSEYIGSDGIDISGVQSIAQEVQKATAQTEMSALKLDSIMSGFEVGDIDYVNQSQNVKYETGTSSTLQTIYNLNSSTNIGNLVSNTDQASLNEFARLLAPTLVQVIKNEL